MNGDIYIQINLDKMKHIKLFERFYKPSQDIKDRLISITKELRAKLHGGIIFFEELDSRIKDIANQDIVLGITKGCKNEFIATSGGFGDTIYKLYKEGKIPCKGMVVFNGKMFTNKIGVESWYPKEFDINNKSFVYIDDSYFSGGTVEKIRNFLKSVNSNIKAISVIYDGCKIKNKDVRSFFRWHSDFKK